MLTLSKLLFLVHPHPPKDDINIFHMLLWHCLNLWINGLLQRKKEKIKIRLCTLLQFFSKNYLQTKTKHIKFTRGCNFCNTAPFGWYWVNGWLDVVLFGLLKRSQIVQLHQLDRLSLKLKYNTTYTFSLPRDVIYVNTVHHFRLILSYCLTD